MKSYFKNISLLICTIVIISNCSRKRDSFVSRNFHALAAKDNILFNGYNALEEGRKALNNSYQDNYYDILPVERMQVDEAIVLPGQSKNQDFERAEEKAVKAIQKHGMNIDGKERNPQIDEAYLLLGKARYFDQRFIPALEAFNYILYKYPASNNINHAKIWREKTNIRLENYQLAITNLKHLLKQNLEKQDLADASAMLAQAYIDTKSIDSAITQIQTAAKFTKSNDEKGRYRFIEGQLYNTLGYKDSADIAFDKVIDLHRKTPRAYYVGAQLEKIKNFDHQTGNKQELLEHLAKIEKNRENRPYLNKIYHQIAEYHNTNKSDSLAIVYYNKSLRSQNNTDILNAKNYETLGDIYFDNAEYKSAGAYYDSTLTNLKVDSKPYRVIKRKRDNLEDVIKYEGIAQTNDSILKLVALPKADRLALFEAYVEKLKIEAEAEKERQAIAERNKGIVVTENDSRLINTERSGGLNRGGTSKAPTFYFYNPTTVAYGKNEFQKIWGNRKHEDNWRWSSRSTNSANTTVDQTTTLTEEELYDPEFYISKIPSEPKVIDSLKTERDFAYYQLGLIYKEKFKEYNLSKSKFNQLLNYNPAEKLVLPSKYNLYKIHTVLDESLQANTLKQDIITNYPESRYAAILQNPELLTTNDEGSPESLYKNLMQQFETQNFSNIIEKSDTYISAFEGDAVIPKLELLKAKTIGRLQGLEAYKKALNYVALTYANTDEGKQAQNLLNTTIPKLQSKSFITNDEADSYKVLFQFDKASTESINTFNTTLNEAVQKLNSDLTTSIDVYTPEITFVVVHGLQSAAVAKDFNAILKPEDKYKISKPFIAIASENYETVQIKKNLNDYLTNQSK